MPTDEELAAIARGLTTKQREVLLSLPGHYADHYPPVRKLIALGICQFRRVGLGEVLECTEVGLRVRAHLEKAHG